MIKFSTLLSQAQVITALANMGKQYQVHFSLVRPMSGGAYVIMVKEAGSHQQLSSLLAIMNERDDIAYIEQDKMMHHYQQPSQMNAQ